MHWLWVIGLYLNAFSIVIINLQNEGFEIYINAFAADSLWAPLFYEKPGIWYCRSIESKSFDTTQYNAISSKSELNIHAAIETFIQFLHGTILKLVSCQSVSDDSVDMGSSRRPSSAKSGQKSPSKSTVLWWQDEEHNREGTGRGMRKVKPMCDCLVFVKNWNHKDTDIIHQFLKNKKLIQSRFFFFHYTSMQNSLSTGWWKINVMETSLCFAFPTSEQTTRRFLKSRRPPSETDGKNTLS